MLCTYFTSYRVVNLRAAWVKFDAPGWLDRDPYGIHTSSLSYNNTITGNKITNNTNNNTTNNKITETSQSKIKI